MSADSERIYDTLARIKEYCERIAFHMHRFGGREKFMEDWSYQDSCVMILAQVGEETKKIEPWLSFRSDYPWSNVIRFRDFAYHNYPSTNYKIVWEILENDIPHLLNVIIDLIDTFDDSSVLSMNGPKRKGLFGKRS